ncbi:MAG: tRNA preQ1(34) S-adenosylmethionine ribosyltransferase-isomerase QueA [Patescibacteria group bacterium]|jgi:S-adenosylmethionine:tRNA ribosyltransferase-isomerase
MPNTFRQAPKSFVRIVKQYDYTLPKELIAQTPARPRDSSRLLVYDRKTKHVQFDTFRNLGKYLPKNAMLVFNETKVIPARLTLTRKTGGKVRVLYVGTAGKNIRVLADRLLSLPAKRGQPSQAGAAEQLTLAKQLSFTVIRHAKGEYILKPSFPVTKLFTVLEKFGSTPLPPYLKHSPLTEAQRKKEYQAIFAKRSGSVAAPTASLHFTKRLLADLKRQGIGMEYVTLHVNLGTFAPLTPEKLKTKKLHAETFAISPTVAQALNKAKLQNRPIIAVGTTVARALESSVRNGKLKAGNDETRLFIQPGYKCQMVNGLITNFHVPQSSLLMLVASLTGRSELMRIYQQAIRKKLRFFSFGDGMLVK